MRICGPGGWVKWMLISAVVAGLMGGLATAQSSWQPNAARRYRERRMRMPPMLSQTTDTTLTRRLAPPMATPNFNSPYYSFKRQELNPRRIYTSRPLLAVGKLKELDLATSTVLIAIDRKRSQIPNALKIQAAKVKSEQWLLDTEFPAERIFKLKRMTEYWDGRPNPDKPQTRADTGKIREDKQRLTINDFKPGMDVSILYVMSMDPRVDARVLNMSVVDPNQTYFELDFDPTAHARAFARRNRSTSGTLQADRSASASLASDRPTTRTLANPQVQKMMRRDAMATTSTRQGIHRIMDGNAQVAR